jgi:hypothetical protein
MTVTAKTLLEAKFAENAQTTQYTVPAGTRTIVDKFTATNVTGASATLVINVVPSAGTAGSSNIITQTKTIASGATEVFPEQVGQILNAGDFISTLAGTASALVIRISGREIT